MRQLLMASWSERLPCTVLFIMIASQRQRGDYMSILAASSSSSSSSSSSASSCSFITGWQTQPYNSQANRQGSPRATVGPRKPFSRGPITDSFCRCRDRDPKGGDMASARLYGVWGISVVSSLVGPETESQPKMDFMHRPIWGLRSEKSHIWNTFFIIFERWRDPLKRRGARETFLISSLSTGLLLTSIAYRLQDIIFAQWYSLQALRMRVKTNLYNI